MLRQRVLDSVAACSGRVVVHTGSWRHDLDQARCLPTTGGVQVQVGTRRLALAFVSCVVMCIRCCACLLAFDSQCGSVHPSIVVPHGEAHGAVPADVLPSCPGGCAWPGSRQRPPRAAAHYCAPHWCRCRGWKGAACMCRCSSHHLHPHACPLVNNCTAPPPSPWWGPTPPALSNLSSDLNLTDMPASSPLFLCGAPHADLLC